MDIQQISTGTVANDKTGTDLRDAGAIINENFAAIAAAATTAVETASAAEQAATGAQDSALASAGIASGAADTATDQAAIATAQASVSVDSSAVSVAGATTSTAQAVIATNAANSAATSAAIQSILSATPTALPYEVTAITGGGGTGGTPGTYVGVTSGGPPGFQWSVVVDSTGAAVPRIDNPGLSTSNAVPTLTMPTISGLTGATAPTATVAVVPVNRIFYAPSSDGSQLLAWGNNAGSLATAPFGAAQLTQYVKSALDPAVSVGNALGYTMSLTAHPSYARVWTDQYGHFAMGIDSAGNVAAYNVLATSLTVTNPPTFPGFGVGARATSINPTPGYLFQQVDPYGHWSLRLKTTGEVQIYKLLDASGNDVYGNINTALTNAAAAQASAAAGGKSTNTQALIAAIRNNGYMIRPAYRLATADTPTVTLSAAGAASSISGAVTIDKSNAALTYVSGLMSLAGSGYPKSGYWVSRGGYYGIGGSTAVYRSGYVAYHFSHTGTTLEALVLGSGSGGSNLKVLVNGCDAGNLSVPNTTGGLYNAIIQFPSSGTRTITIITAGVPVGGLYIEPTASVANTGEVYPLATFVSDSFWEGVGAANGGISPVVMARRLGLNCALAGVGGTGMLNPGGTDGATGATKVPFTDATRLLDLTLSGQTDLRTGAVAAPLMGVVGASLNDQGLASSYFSPDATLYDAIRRRTFTMIDAWATANPGKPLVLFGPTWPSGPPGNRPPLTIYNIRDAVEEACDMMATSNVWFLDRLMPPQREGVLTTTTDQAWLYTGGADGTDSTHPTPLGHTFDGRVGARQLRDLILTKFA